VRIQELVVDCQDPSRLAAFWGALLDAPWALVHDGWAVLDADVLRLAFQRVPEGKQSHKNRLHLDVEAQDVRWALARARALGAVPTGHRELDAQGDGYVVLRDPEGNELCLVVDQAGGWGESQRSALAAVPAPARVWHVMTAAALEALLTRIDVDAHDEGPARAGSADPDETFPICDAVDLVAVAERVAAGERSATGGTPALVAVELDAGLAMQGGQRGLADGAGATTGRERCAGPLDPSWIVGVRPLARA
jgi:hypothetical protein